MGTFLQKFSLFTQNSNFAELRQRDHKTKREFNTQKFEWRPFDLANSDCWSLILISVELQNAFLHTRTVDFVPNYLHWNRKEFLYDLYKEEEQIRCRTALEMYIWACKYCFKTDLKIYIPEARDCGYYWEQNCTLSHVGTHREERWFQLWINTKSQSVAALLTRGWHCETPCTSTHSPASDVRCIWQLKNGKQMVWHHWLGCNIFDSFNR